MTDGRSFFDQPVRNNIKIYENVTKVAIGGGSLLCTKKTLPVDCSRFDLTTSTWFRSKSNTKK